MTMIYRSLTAAAALGAVAVLDAALPNGSGVFEAPAYAVVGRPLTPVSVAGVARRTTRRAVVAGAAMTPPPPTVVVVPAPAPAVVVAPVPPQQ